MLASVTQSLYSSKHEEHNSHRFQFHASNRASAVHAMRIRQIASMAVVLAALGSTVSNAASGPAERDRFGYALPVNSTTAIWTNHLTPRNWNDSVVHEGIEYFPRDSYKNLDKSKLRGVIARKVGASEPLWHTTFPPEVAGADTDRDERLIESSAVVLRGNRLLCTYLVTPPAKPGTTAATAKAAPPRYWAFVILDTASGKVLRRERANAPTPQVNFVMVGDVWFAMDERAQQTLRLDPASGAPIWTHPAVLRVATVTEQAVSSFRKVDDSSWQVTALDLATGAVIFDQRLTGLSGHIVKGAIARNGQVFAEFGAQYDWNFERGAKYRTYSVAFDAHSGKPLWRTPFFD